jgi:hypothetical protein
MQGFLELLASSGFLLCMFLCDSELIPEFVQFLPVVEGLAPDVVFLLGLHLHIVVVLLRQIVGALLVDLHFLPLLGERLALLLDGLVGHHQLHPQLLARPPSRLRLLPQLSCFPLHLVVGERQRL